MQASLRVLIISSIMFCFQMNASSPYTAARVEQFIQENKNSVILFHRAGCPYCAYVRPLFEAVQAKYAPAVAFLSVEVMADLYNLKTAFDFATVPLFIYIKDGVEQVGRRHGSNNKRLQLSDLEAIIQALYF